MSTPTDPGRVLVTGAAGMLGTQLRIDAPRGFTTLGTDLRAADGGVGAASGPPRAAAAAAAASAVPAVEVGGVDLADPATVARLFAEHGPFTGVLHCAAWTAVDLAEEKAADAERANVAASRELARAAHAAGIPLVAVSTDFVFDGRGTRPYREDDPTCPLSVYGRTKLAGEIAAREEHPQGVRIVRTQWLYGPRGKHFPGTILALSKERKELRVVHDQVGAPTSTLELSPALWDVLQRGEAGIYHAACAGQASWFEFACATLELAGVRGVRVDPCTTEEFPRPAARPRYSVLDCERLARLRGRPLAHWRAALATFLEKES